MKTRGTIATIISGGLLLGVLALSWREIVVQYHLSCLRTDSNRLRELVVQPGGSTAHRAVVDFLGTSRGEQVFLTTYLQPLVALLERRNDFDPLLRCRTAIVSSLDGSLEWQLFGPRQSANGSCGKRATRFLVALDALLPRLAGKSLANAAYPDHDFTVLSLRDIDALTASPFRPWASRGRMGILIRHRTVLLGPGSRIVGGWEYMAGDGKSPIFFSSIRFMENARFAASKVSQTDSSDHRDWAEVIHTGAYDVEANSVTLSYDSGQREAYRIEFTNADHLHLQGDRGLNGFRRPTDVPSGWRNRIGSGALERADR